MERTPPSSFSKPTISSGLMNMPKNWNDWQAPVPSPRQDSGSSRMFHVTMVGSGIPQPRPFTKPAAVIVAWSPAA